MTLQTTIRQTQKKHNPGTPRHRAHGPSAGHRGQPPHRGLLSQWTDRVFMLGRVGIDIGETLLGTVKVLRDTVRKAASRR